MKKSITTKIGDCGNTRLYSGETVNKRSKRIIACGDIDELVCFLGLAYSYILKDEDPLDPSLSDILSRIHYIQKKLFVIASEIATIGEKLENLPERINEWALSQLDALRDDLEASIILPDGFIIPGDNELSARIDICRAISRRCERNVVELYNEGFISNKFLLMWLNRLSDYLYLLARYSENNKYRMVKINGE